MVRSGDLAQADKWGKVYYLAVYFALDCEKKVRGWLESENELSRAGE
jgi:hypothetical protein